MAAKKAKSSGKSNRGGKRAGAGRKTKAANQLRADFNAAANDLIAPVLPRLISNLLKLADGVTLREVDPKDGTVDYYVTPPDRNANEYLINRLCGKPTEKVECDLTKLPDAELIARAKSLVG